MNKEEWIEMTHRNDDAPLIGRRMIAIANHPDRFYEIGQTGTIISRDAGNDYWLLMDTPINGYETVCIGSEDDDPSDHENWLRFKLVQE